MNTLLVVEDEKLIRQGIVAMIRRSSVPVEEILECRNGEEALEILRKQRVDVMFTDIRMPKMDGLTLVNKMEELSQKPVVIVLSGYDEFSYAVEMMKHGVRDYILKPIKRETIEQLLENLERELSETRETEEEEEETEEEQKADKTGELTPGVKRSLTMILISIFLWFTAYNAVTTAFSRYARTVWGMEGGGFANCLMVATVAAIISYIPIGMISAKVGRKKTIMGGLVLMLISFFAAIFFTEYHAVINLGFALIGMGWAAVSVNSLPMVVEMCSSEDVGKYTGLYYTFSMSAQIVTPILSGVFLQYVSYRTLFPYACVFTVAAMITMSMVHHGDNKPERKKNLLENFDVED